MLGTPNQVAIAFLTPSLTLWWFLKQLLSRFIPSPVSNIG